MLGVESHCAIAHAHTLPIYSCEKVFAPVSDFFFLHIYHTDSDHQKKIKKKKEKNQEGGGRILFHSTAGTF